MYKQKNRGFTLIELLVVTSIISLLSSVVLVTLDTARNNAKLAAVRGNMNTIRTQAELYANNNFTYGDTANEECADVIGESNFLNNTVAIETLQQLGTISGNGLDGMYCGIGDGTWAISIDMERGGDSYIEVTNSDGDSGELVTYCFDNSIGEYLQLGGAYDESHSCGGGTCTCIRAEI